LCDFHTKKKKPAAKGRVLTAGHGIPRESHPSVHESTGLPLQKNIH
jgi:hypothetical protein